MPAFLILFYSLYATLFLLSMPKAESRLEGVVQVLMAMNWGAVLVLAGWHAYRYGD